MYYSLTTFQNHIFWTIIQLFGIVFALVILSLFLLFRLLPVFDAQLKGKFPTKFMFVLALILNVIIIVIIDKFFLRFNECFQSNYCLRSGGIAFAGMVLFLLIVTPLSIGIFKLIVFLKSR